jgi:hypothetical protein
MNFNSLLSNALKLIEMIPRQVKGSQSSTCYKVSSGRSLEASIIYNRARESLLNVNDWHRVAGGGARFQLVNEMGEKLHAMAKQDDFIRISIPNVPGPSDGDGFEWVRVENIEEKWTSDMSSIAMSVRPAVPPIPQKKHIAHFFTDEATSTFYLERSGKSVKAAVFGRNEKPNIGHAGWLDAIRNLIVSVAAILGFNKPQWKKFVTGLLKKSAF